VNEGGASYSPIGNGLIALAMDADMLL